MSDLFEKNLSLFSESNPEGAAHLMSVDCSAYAFCKTQNNEENLSVQLSGKTKYFHSQTGAEEEAQQVFSSFEMEKVDVFFVLGVGFGYFLEAASSWLEEDPKRQIVFLEEDLAAIHLLLEHERGGILLSHPQVKLIWLHGNDPFRQLTWMFLQKKIQVAILPFYEKEKREYCTSIKQCLLFESSEKNDLVWEFLSGGEVFFKNFYKNLLLLPCSYRGEVLTGQFSNVPAIICGAGPSLKKNMKQLSELKNSALVFAGGSAMNALNAADVLPHFGAGIDPNIEQSFRVRDQKAHKVPFFYRDRIHYDVLRSIQGPKVHIAGAGGYPIASWIAKKLGLATCEMDEGHNVVSFCTELAKMMGCNPIIFVGMDLAFTEGKKYAQGVLESVDVLENEQDLIWKKGVDGKSIQTKWMWVAESQWLGEFAKQNPNLNLFNCTEGGLGFPGVQNESLQVISDRELQSHYDAESRIREILQQKALPHVNRKEIVKVLKEIAESLLRSAEHLHKMWRAFGTKGEKGLIALHEVELEEELGFQVILEPFDRVHHLTCSHQHNTLSEHEIQKSRCMFLLEIVQKNLAFLKDALEEAPPI